VESLRMSWLKSLIIGVGSCLILTSLPFAVAKCTGFMGETRRRECYNLYLGPVHDRVSGFSGSHPNGFRSVYFGLPFASFGFKYEMSYRLWWEYDERNLYRSAPLPDPQLFMTTRPIIRLKELVGNLFVYGVLVGIVLGMAKRFKAHVRRKSSLCRCGYSLCGLVGSRCPECGIRLLKDADAATRIRSQR